MDFEFEERDLEMEKEYMMLNIDGLEIKIPEELIKERMSTLYLESIDEAILDIKLSLSGYLKCLKENELKNPQLNEKIILWLTNEIDIYKPDNQFYFCPTVGFDLP